MYETTGLIDRNLYREVYLYCCQPYKKQIIIFELFIAILGVISPVVFDTPVVKSIQIFIIINFMAFVPISSTILIAYARQIEIRRINDLVGKDYMRVTTKFMPDGIYYYNHETNDHIVFKYENLIRFVNTKNYYTFYTPMNYLVVVFKDRLTEQEQKDFLPWIRKRTTNIRWSRY